MLTLEHCQDSNRITHNIISAVGFNPLKKGPFTSSYHKGPYVLIKLSLKLQWCGISFDLYQLNISGYKGLI